MPSVRHVACPAGDKCMQLSLTVTLALTVLRCMHIMTSICRLRLTVVLRVCKHKILAPLVGVDAVRAVALHPPLVCLEP